jgi:hypothetical protein
VNRGGKGRRNQFTKASQKIFLAPYYNEYFEATSLETYDNMIVGGGSPELVGSTVREIGEKLQTIRDKINRAKELQAAQVFETGIITLVNGDNIDFKRKAGSLVDPGGGNYWDTAATDVESQIVAAGTFIRNEGKNPVKELDMTLSQASWIALQGTTYFSTKANYNQVTLLAINRPVANATGSTFHGQITAGQFIVNVWVYDEVYEDDAGAITRFMSENQTIFLPAQGTRFTMTHAGVPKTIHDPNRAEFNEFITNEKAEFAVYNNIDRRRFSHEFGIMSAPIAVPVSIDMIYTLQTLP